MSIRLRLTLLYSLILALTLLVFGGVLYAVVANASLTAAQRQLTSEGLILSSGRPSTPVPDLSKEHLTIQFRKLADGATIFPQPGQAPPPQSVGTLPLSSSELNTLQNGDSVGPYVTTINGQQVLLYDLPVFSRAGAIILQLARPLQAAEGGLDTVQHVMIAAGVAAVLLAFGIGWVLAGAGLRPINRITQTAQAIGAAQDFDRRVDYSGPADEVGRLASTFNTMLSRLQSAYQTQRRFVADASHELRTPLTSIRGNLGLLQREPPISPADRAEVLADLVAESERVNRLVNDLLTLARADAGRALQREAVAVAPLLGELARRLGMLYPDRTLQVEAAPDVVACGDRDGLLRVLLNLMDNALKFTPPGGTVSVTGTAQEGRVAITVRDSGPGIAPEAQVDIFERFYQVDTARTGMGTGLGLAIAHALVVGQGGALGVESAVGRGSTFTVTLPAAALPAADAGSPTVAEAAPPLPVSHS